MNHRVGDAVKGSLSLVCDDNHRCRVGLEDRHILDNIIEDIVRCPGDAGNDERFRGEIDMLFVLDDIR